MKRKITFAIVAAAALCAFCSCKNEEEVVVVRAVTVTPSSMTLDAGDTEVLTAEVSPSNATDKTVVWTSSDPNVATVNENGVVTAVGSGKAVITGKSGTKSGTCEVTVMGSATGIKLSPESIELSYNETATLVAIVEPEGFVKNTAVTWTSSNAELLKVEGSGLSAKVTAASTKGEFTVTVKTEDGGFTAESKVSVVGLSANGFKTAAELVAFLEKAEEYETEDIKLASDIDLAGAVLPSATNFKGTFNGQGYSITNATINNPVFLINEGTVKNLVIAANCKIQPSVGEFAPIVGINKGTVSGCTNNAYIGYTSSEEEYILVGGIVERNDREGVIENCTNNGEINVVVNDGVKSDAPTVGGIVGASGGFIRSCQNAGKITHNPGVAVLKKGGTIGELIAGKNNIPNHAGGIVGWFVVYDTDNAVGLVDRGIEDCTNTATVTVTAKGGQETATCRAYVSGIAGSVSGGYLKNCTNEGAITLDHDSGLNAAATADKQMWCAGIYNVNLNDHVPGGGYTYPACSGATNRGDVTLKTDCTAAYMYVGGICGNTDIENNATTCVNPLISECTNYGKVLGTGYGKIRAGGITAQTGNLKKCINYGEIELGPNCLANANAGSFAGNLCCYHAGAGHCIVDCEAYGNIKLGATKQMAGGFVGILGGALGATPINGKVNCTVSGPEGSYCGILTGYCNATDQWIVGSAESPMYVAGKIVVGTAETVLTEANYLESWGQTYNPLVAWDKSGAHESTYIKFLK